MDLLLQMLRRDFLLHDALVGSVLVGLVCPLVGVYFVLRRMVLLGVALPQLAAAGIAFAFLMTGTLVGAPLKTPSAHVLATVGALLFTLGGTFLLAVLERRGREMVEARIGVSFAVAGAATMLFLAADPLGEPQMVSLWKGDLLATTATNVSVLLAVLGAVVFLLFVLRKEFLLVSFDRELAVVFGRRAGSWDALLYVLTAVTIALGVTTAGPLVTFGFLVVPPVAARRITQHMTTCSLMAAAIGGLSAFIGFYAAYRFDVPLGPAEVAVASLVLFLVSAGTAVGGLRRGRL
jgi:ABC-type Mn2+/Zn2+ transport system permease subunit